MSGSKGARPRVAKIVRREVAELEIARNPLQIAVASLPWVASHCVLGNGAGDFHDRSADSIYYDHWLPLREGTTCGGMAIFFKKVLHDLGAVDAFTLNVGRPGVTHVTVIVPYAGRFFLFDPLTGSYFSDDSGQPTDIVNVLRGRSHVVQLYFRRKYVGRYAKPLRWRVLLKGGDAAITYGWRRYYIEHCFDRAAMLASMGSFYRRAGFDITRELLPQFLAAGVISHDGGEHGERLRRVIQDMRDRTWSDSTRSGCLAAAS